VSEVAARHGVCENLVFTWRRQARDGVLMAPDMPAFMPVQVHEAASTAADVCSPVESRPGALPAPARSQAGLIEIELGDGRQVRVGADVSLPALQRVLTALRG
jgi:transposase